MYTRQQIAHICITRIKALSGNLNNDPMKGISTTQMNRTHAIGSPLNTNLHKLKVQLSWSKGLKLGCNGAMGLRLKKRKVGNNKDPKELVEHLWDMRDPIILQHSKA